jgi:alanine racemase
MMSSPRSIITVDLGAVRHNVRFLRGKLHPGTGFLAAVKADGYGHGMLECACAAVAGGADGAAVATAEEAVTLRGGGFSDRILVMGPLFALDQCEEMAARDVEFAIVSGEMARMVPALAALRDRSQSQVRPARIHIKIDSGMNRQGLLPADLPPLLDSLRAADIQLAGIMTHFPCATDDPASVDPQLERFMPCVRQVKALWPAAIAHAANSAATMYCPQSHFDMVRCGIAVYGLSPGQQNAEAEGLRPALSWTSQVALVKRVPAGEGVGYGHTFHRADDTETALVPLGYADGLFRLASNRGHVLIGGRRYPIAGRVSMDSFTVDLGSGSGVRAGDPVTLIGRDGDLRVSVEDMAGWAETINYEVTCNIRAARAQRVFVSGAAAQ